MTLDPAFVPYFDSFPVSQLSDFAPDWRVEYSQVAPVAEPLTVTVPNGMLDIQFDGFEPEHRFNPYTQIRDKGGSYNQSIQRQTLSKVVLDGETTIDLVYLPGNQGVGYTDPTAETGGIDNSIRPEDGLLYPRGQG